MTYLVAKGLILFVIFFLDVGFYDEIDNGSNDKCEDDEFDVLGILADFVVELVLRYDGVEIPAQSCKDGVPATGTDGGIEQEFAVVHASQSGRNADEVANARNETARECGDDAVFVEVTFRLLDLLLIEQTHLAPLAVGELIDDGTADVESHEIVDGGTEVGTDGGKEDDQPHVQLSAGGMISRWGYYKF